MDGDLTQKKCVPCEGGVEPMSLDEAEEMLEEVPGWGLREGKLARQLKFKNFKQALDFVNKVGELAEEEGHHPNIYLHDWNQVDLTLYTHAINGLHENDFILAAKTNKLLDNQPK